MSTDSAARNTWSPRRSWIRSILSLLIRFLFALLTRLEIEGRENVPSQGPFLVVANHFHFADPVVVIRAMPWPLDFIGGFRMPNAPQWIRWIPRMWGLYRVRRDGSSRGALRQAEATLVSGGVLGIFPEGGSWTNILRKPRPGAAFLATRTGARILPVGLHGVDQIFSELGRFRRAQVTVRIGAPIGPFDPVEQGRAGRARIDEIGDRIMQSIADLIPAETHGVYSKDPERRTAAESVAAYPWERGKTKG